MMISCHRKIPRIAILPEASIGRVKDTETSILCEQKSGITFINCGGRRDCLLYYWQIRHPAVRLFVGSTFAQ
jgi:hypothetical protein